MRRTIRDGVPVTVATIFAAFAALPSCDTEANEEVFWAKKGISDRERERVRGMGGPGLMLPVVEEEEDDPLSTPPP